ncbi:MAG TPA: MBL fold metallo-hydrolase [Terriglobia bacterium]|jgi:glyoxylase-like metal-dependent hydrolase (beta-lactamase superfamily II)
MQLGDFEITPLLDGHFRLDGGSLFGVVPRVLWEKKVVPDERHRIRLAVRCLLVRTGRRVILVDSGQGNKQSEKFRDRYAVEQPVTLLDRLRERGIRLEDVTDVINCHLHFDHAGWNTVRENGRIVPTFPNARYWSQRREWERAQHYTTERDQASFLGEDFLPLEQPRWELIEGPRTVVPGVEILPLAGHTLDTQGVLISAGEKKVAFLGDLIPTRYHVPHAWIAAFDLYPVESLATKRRVLPRAVQEKWTCVFGHDPDVSAARLVEESPGTLGIIPADDFAPAE